MHVDDGRAVLFGRRREVPGAQRQIGIIASREADVLIFGVTIVFRFIQLLFVRRVDERVRGRIGNVGYCSSYGKQHNEDDGDDFLQDIFR